jgi:H+/gluconate symporter-like permease
MSIAWQRCPHIHRQRTGGRIPLECSSGGVDGQGGMDTLPHNGAVITLLAVAGLTHKQSYKDIFAVTLIKTMAVFLIIGVYYVTGLV